MRIKPIELPHFAVGAPAEIAVPRVPYIGVGNALDAARRVELCCHLVGHAFVLHKTMLAGRANGLLVKAHGIGVSPFETSDLGQYQLVLVCERRWIVFGPLAQLFLVRGQQFAPRLLLIGRRGLKSADTVNAV